MKKILNLLCNAELFEGIAKDTILEVVQSKACYLKTFQANVTIYGFGESITYAGIVLDGFVDILHPSINGSESIVSRLSPGATFGASFACTKDTNTVNDIRSTTRCTILFIHIQKLLKEYYPQPELYLQLMENIMRSLAKSNIRLNTKIQVLSQKTLRDKLLTYFELLAEQNNSNEFTLPFNREQLACYLGSERSSVCRELSKLSEAQIIRITKNQVALL